MATLETIDPRIRRTRQMLHRAFQELLCEKSFDAISVQDLAERSTVNRATFYDHFPDKFALLEDLIGENFRTIFQSRMQGRVGACPNEVRQLILTVCDFLSEITGGCQKHRRQFAPIVEARIKTLVRDSLLAGLRESAGENLPADAELRATMASWAICGAAMEWSQEGKIPAEEFANAVLPLVFPTIQLPHRGVEVSKEGRKAGI